MDFAYGAAMNMRYLTGLKGGTKKASGLRVIGLSPSGLVISNAFSKLLGKRPTLETHYESVIFRKIPSASCSANTRASNFSFN